MPKFQTNHDGVSPGCASGKIMKGLFPSRRNVTSGILQLIHSDICGAMAVKSFGGYLYYIIFVDELSEIDILFEAQG